MHTVGYSEHEEIVFSSTSSTTHIGAAPPALSLPDRYYYIVAISQKK